MPFSVRPILRSLTSVLVLAATLVSGPALAVEQDVDVTLIVERREGSVEIFLGGQADRVVQSLSANVPGLLNENGFVPFERFNSGTWSLADQLIANVGFAIGGQAPELHAMSLMAHPLDQELAFRDAVDAVQAVSICAVLNPPTNLMLEQAQLYAGFISYVDDSEQPVVLTLEPSLRGLDHDHPISVVVYDYANGHLTANWTAQWGADAPLTLQVGTQSDVLLGFDQPLLGLMGLTGLALVLAASALGAPSLRRRLETRPPAAATEASV